MKGKITVEKYVSNLKHREDHYFRMNGEHEEYLFGVNPKIVSKAMVKKILKSIKPLKHYSQSKK